jgi:hypothetical protein
MPTANERRRLRYAQDAEYRKRVCAAVREWRAKRIAEDPTYRERERATRRAAERRRYEDPEYRARRNAARRERKGRRYAEDAEYRERKRAKARAYRASHREEIKERRRQKLLTDAEYRQRKRALAAASGRKRDLQRKYGLSVEQYQAMRAAQGGCCAICGDSPKILVVDHDHDTGRPRRLLCRKCNAGIGFLGDDPALTLAATLYLLQALIEQAGTAAMADAQRAGSARPSAGTDDPPPSVASSEQAVTATDIPPT